MEDLEKLVSLALKYPSYIPKMKCMIDGDYYKYFEKIYSFWDKTGKNPKFETFISYIPEFKDFKKIEDADLMWFIQEHNELQKKSTIFSGIEDILSNDDADLKDIISLWDDSIIDIEPPNIITTSSAKDVLLELNQMKKKTEERVDTGFKQLNSLLTKDGTSGWARKYCYLYQGLTGTGKTFFLSNVAVRLLEQGKNVVFVSIEMDQYQIRDLIYRSYFKVSNKDAIIGAITAGNMFTSNLTVINYSNMSHSILDVQRDIKHLGFKPDAIIIDYLDNFAPSKNVKQSWEVHQVVSTDMARVAQELDVPIITATQTNRQAAGEKGGTKRHLGYESMGSSFNKSHVFAGVWSIISDDADYDENTSTRRFELICNKNREGKQTKTEFYLNYLNARLYEPGDAIKDLSDTFAKVVESAAQSIQTKTTKEDKEERKETQNNYNKYFEKLCEDLNYKDEIKNIPKDILTYEQKLKLERDIKDFRRSSQRSKF